MGDKGEGRGQESQKMGDVIYGKNSTHFDKTDKKIRRS